MADAPGKARYALVEINEVDYAADAHTALMPTAETNTEVYSTLAPSGQVVDQGTPQYTFQLVGLQGTPLWTALVAAEGTVVDVVFQSEFGVGKTQRTFSMFVPRGSMPLGGEEGEWREWDVTFQVQGDVTHALSVA